MPNLSGFPRGVPARGAPLTAYARGVSPCGAAVARTGTSSARTSLPPDNRCSVRLGELYVGRVGTDVDENRRFVHFPRNRHHERDLTTIEREGISR